MFCLLSSLFTSRSLYIINLFLLNCFLFGCCLPYISALRILNKSINALQLSHIVKIENIQTLSLFFKNVKRLFTVNWHFGSFLLGANLFYFWALQGSSLTQLLHPPTRKNFTWLNLRYWFTRSYVNPIHNF